MIPFLFSKVFKIVNDKQTTDELYILLITSMEPFHQSLNCHIDHTKHKVYISFQISHRVFLGLSAYKECVFSFKLFK